MEPNQTNVMAWEMYGPGCSIQFSGHREGEAFGLRVTRDETTILAVAAPSVDSLLRCSTELRDQLYLLGFAAHPLTTRTTQLTGGPCWGPAAPLNAGLLQSVRSAVFQAA
jgi:hypothetical protein